VALAGVGAVSVIEAASADIATISRVVCFALKLMSPFSLVLGASRAAWTVLMILRSCAAA
jgi:hypothetical protein